MKTTVGIALLLAGCSGAATDDQSSETAISNQAIEIEKAADDDVNATIAQIREQSDSENLDEAEAGQTEK